MRSTEGPLREQKGPGEKQDGRRPKDPRAGEACREGGARSVQTFSCMGAGLPGTLLPDAEKECRKRARKRAPPRKEAPLRKEDPAFREYVEMGRGLDRQAKKEAAQPANRRAGQAREAANNKAEDVDKFMMGKIGGFIKMRREIDAFRLEIEQARERSVDIEGETEIHDLAHSLDELLSIVAQKQPKAGASAPAPSQDFEPAPGQARAPERNRPASPQFDFTEIKRLVGGHEGGGKAGGAKGRGGPEDGGLTEDVLRADHGHWEDYNLKKEVLLGIQNKGYEWPSPIQEASIRPSLENRDIVARAKNGTGKAGAFIIPLLHKVDRGNPALQALILIPTRELALQTAKICKELGKFMDLKILPLYGGVNTKDDVIRVKNGVQILVGTPGRVLDFVEQRVLDLSGCRHLVCDEADKLLSREFKDVLYKLADKLPARRQIEMYSATFPSMVQDFIDSFMNAPIKINLMKELALKGVKQYYAFVKKADKLHCLKTLLTKLDLNQCFIFCNSIINVERLAKRVTETGFTSYFIHSKMKQEDRNMVFHNFTQGECRILVSTDLVTRGIDVPSVNVVINFDFPRSTESYLHRIGRSGRFGNAGIAINLVTEDDKQRLEEIEAELGVEILPFSSKVAS